MSVRLSIREMFSLINVDIQEAQGDLPFPSHVATDSRDVNCGSLFVALEGERTDGHNYIPQAVQNGASVVVLRKGKRIIQDMPRTLLVELEEPEAELAKMASIYLDKAAPKEIIAVTGSVGKTTTREALLHELQKKFNVHSSSRSLNTRIGCSSVVLAMPMNAEILLLELGANKPGEIAELTELFSPTIAIITEVAPVHLEGFGSLNGVLSGKMEIARSKKLHSFLYNGDNKLLRATAAELPDKIRTLSVGEQDSNFLIQNLVFTLKEDGHGRVLPSLDFSLSAFSDRACFSAGVWGNHLSRPLAFAAATGFLLGISLEESACTLSTFTGMKGRGRVLPIEGGGHHFIVDDAYNANPASLRASLETFAALSIPGKKAAVLGDMKELGEGEVSYHKDFESVIEKLDLVIFVGKIWSKAIAEKPGRHFTDNWQGALELIINEEWLGLLVKGSNSLGLENLVNSLSPEIK